MRFRFAPSPTGYLHVGNVRTALINWLWAQQTGGAFWLRIDDTDHERSRPEYIDAIHEDLRWLGLDWQEEFKQSDRLEAYHNAVEKLKKSGRLYPCYETADELEVKRKMQLGRGKPPIYDRAALSLTQAQIQAYEQEGRRPHWRFRLDESAPISWEDVVRGEVSFDPKTLSDPILLRESGIPTYHLPSCVDDGDFAMTHIVRGEDHVSNTAWHIQILEALGYPPPQYAHLSLLRMKDGKLSKRLGGLSIRELREDGMEAIAILDLLARLGSAQNIEPHTNIDSLASAFDIRSYGRAMAIFDPEELTRLNHKIVTQLGYDEVRERLNAMGLDTVDHRFWETVRPNLNRLAEVRDWWQICYENVNPVIEEPDYTRAAARLLPDTPWDEHTFKSWMAQVKEKTGRKGKALFLPIRLALTGREDGPELHPILPLIGREETRRRLEGTC